MTSPGGPLGATGQALRALELRQQVSAHNLANTSTPGFRADRVFTLAGGEGEGPVALQGRSENAGPLNVTERPLDLALEGEGYLVVSTPQGERLTRHGGFALDADRRLVDGTGHPVLGEGGEIVLPEGTPVVTMTGAIHVNGLLVDTLRIERPVFPGAMEPNPALDGAGEPAPGEIADAGVPDGAANPDGLNRMAGPAGVASRLPAEAGGLLVIPDGVQLEPATGVRVRQGALEGSNVEPVLAMTDMIEIQRSFASLQRSVHVLDGVLDTVANGLGRVT